MTRAGIRRQDYPALGRKDDRKCKTTMPPKFCHASAGLASQSLMEPSLAIPHISILKSVLSLVNSNHLSDLANSRIIHYLKSFVDHGGSGFI